MADMRRTGSAAHGPIQLQKCATSHYRAATQTLFQNGGHFDTTVNIGKSIDTTLHDVIDKRKGAMPVRYEMKGPSRNMSNIVTPNMDEIL